MVSQRLLVVDSLQLYTCGEKIAVRGYRSEQTANSCDPCPHGMLLGAITYNVSRVCDAAPSPTRAEGPCGGAARRSAA